MKNKAIVITLIAAAGIGILVTLFMPARDGVEAENQESVANSEAAAPNPGSNDAKLKQIARMDTNKDGKASAQEFVALWLNYFDKLDYFNIDDKKK